MQKRTILITLLMLMLVTIIACGLPGAVPTETEPSIDDLEKTLSAAQTLSAGSTAVAELTLRASTSTPTPGAPVPTAGILYTPTPDPNQPQPTLIIPTLTPVSVAFTATPITTLCLQAKFVADVTYPDYTVVAPSTAFRKIWRIQNIGTCSWTPDFSLVWVDGFKMNGANPQAIGVNVQPGQTADIGVNLVSQASPPGTYESYYKLQNPSGQKFGIGPTASNPIWIKIKVQGERKVVYEMMADVKRAAWSNSVGAITFGDISNPNNGYAIDNPAPQIETGATENETGLVMHPNAINTGFVQGIFPAYTIKNGDRFQSAIGCQYGYVKCNVKFTLSYRVEGGSPVKIASWDEINEGQVNKLDVDLSSLTGKTVSLILSVSTNNDPTDDFGIWLRPRITGY